RGLFKFISQSQTRKPLRQDLLRVLRQGVEGTSMPAFGALSNDKFGFLTEEQLEQVASAVIHLSIRGQVEYALMSTLLSNQRPSRENEATGEKMPVSIAEGGKDVLQRITAEWVDAPNHQVVPQKGVALAGADLEESVRRGFELFSNQGKTDCISCHYDYGRRSRYLFDEWGTVVRPMDLTLGTYRGGRRP